MTVLWLIAWLVFATPAINEVWGLGLVVSVAVDILATFVWAPGGEPLRSSDQTRI